MDELKISNEEMRDEELNAILNGAVGEKVKTPEEYIKRSDVLKKAICLIQGPTGEEHLRFCAVPFDDIQNLPAADVAPVVHGRWIHTKKGKKCSSCGCLSALWDKNLNSCFCPWCGAKMDGGTENAVGTGL